MSQIQPMIKIEFNQERDFFIIRIGKISEFVSGNFIRHQLGVRYEKKDGTIVTAQDIEISKRKSRKALQQSMKQKLSELA